MAIMAEILKNLFFASFPESKDQFTWNLNGSIRVTWRSVIAKIVFDRESKTAAILKIDLSASSSESKNQLTWNLVWSIRVTCRSKIVKSFTIGNPRWTLWPPSWKSIFRIFSWTERPADLKLGRKHWGDLLIKKKKKKKKSLNCSDWKSKMAPWRLSWKSIFSLLLLNRKVSWFETW